MGMSQCFPFLLRRDNFVKTLYFSLGCTGSPNNFAITLSWREQAAYINKDGKDGLSGATPRDIDDVTWSQRESHSHIRFLPRSVVSLFPVTLPLGLLLSRKTEINQRRGVKKKRLR